LKKKRGVAEDSLKNLVFVLIAILAVSSCEKKNTGMPAASAEAKILGADSFRVTVNVPERHHAYLDRGKDGNLIPVQFDWTGFAPQPAPRSSPAGEYDDTVRAQVLRGSGNFDFQADTASLRKKTFSMKIQICDEVKGLCYRPNDISVEIL